MSSNPDVKEELEANQPEVKEEVKPLFGGTDSQGKERIFQTTEEAQQSWQSAQNFIKDKVDESKSLEVRIQELEAQLNQSTKLEDALAQLKDKEESPVIEPEQQQTTESTPQVDVDALTAAITQSVIGQLSEADSAKVQHTNKSQSMEAAKAVYGENFESKLRETAEGLGMSDSDILQTAESNPTLFKKVFGLDKQQNRSFTPSSGFNAPVKSDKVDLKLGNKGFSTSQMLGNHMSNIEALMKKHS